MIVERTYRMTNQLKRKEQIIKKQVKASKTEPFSNLLNEEISRNTKEEKNKKQLDFDVKV